MNVQMGPFINDETKTVLKRRYGINDIAEAPEDTNQVLADRIRQEAQGSGKTILNQIPSQFDHSDPEKFDVIPQYQFPVWKTLSDNFEFFGIKGGVLWLQPAAWQFAYAFHQICRRHKLFIAYGDTYNLPVAAEIVRQARISALVTSLPAALNFKEELETSGSTTSLNLAIICRDVRAAAKDPAEFNIKGATTLWEIQLFPGHTIAHQSFSLAGNRNAFHLSEDYLWRFEADATYITGLSPKVLPVLNYRLPVIVRPTDTVSNTPAYTFEYA